MADVELLPLPSEVRLAIRAYARACVEANLAPLQAENERLRAEVAEWKRVAAAQAELHGEAESRAERLAEALRDARRALAFAAQYLPECNEPYERANDALAQEDRNG